MSVTVSKRAQRVKPSPTLAVTARAARHKPEGHDIIGLGVGEPDFDTPAHIAEAGIAAIRSGFTRYTAVDGIAELKDAIIGKFERENRLKYTRSQILVSAGAKQTIYNLCAAILDPGDEAIIPTPCWVSYPDMALLSDGTPVFVHAGAELVVASVQDSIDRGRARACSSSTARAIRPGLPIREPSSPRWGASC